MVSLRYRALIGAVEQAISSSGYAGSLISDISEIPFRILISGPSCDSMPLWVYIKNLTPADRDDSDEFRIQLRSKIVPLALNPGGPTLLLGYHADRNIFVGFDPLAISLGAKTQLSGGYVSLKVASRAVHRGMSFDRDRRNRIAVGIRPDMLVPYSLHASEIHGAADDAHITTLLDQVTEAFQSAEGRNVVVNESSVAPDRTRLLRSIHVLCRSAGFRGRVLEAYERKCAVTGIQLGLVDAAHILPVCINGSTDKVENGISLLPQYHRAFDCGLIYLTTSFEMRVNLARVKQLENKGIVQGLEEFKRPLGQISLPKHQEQWPDRKLIERANAIRGIK